MKTNNTKYTGCHVTIELLAVGTWYTCVIFILNLKTYLAMRTLYYQHIQMTMFWDDETSSKGLQLEVGSWPILLYSIIYSDIHLYQTFTFSIHLVMCVAMEGPRHYSVEKGHVCLQKWIIEGLMGVTVEC